MYGKSILAVLGLFLLSGFGYYKHADYEGGSAFVYTLTASKDVSTDVTRKIESLPAELTKLKTAEQKVEKIRDTLAWIEALRKVSGTQSMSREVSMDYLIEPLQAFVQSEYRADNCPYFKTYINSQYEPSEDGEVSHPSLKRAQRVIASVCPYVLTDK